ncbi:hypothetical protein [Actinomadura litoris]|uniref:hypothetical protein n=1 Tax=Actinomadura litoris TaxID=2678616 RepID=UPI001FA74D49|nr:hypothetical protein [Actinomadura litoris]
MSSDHLSRRTVLTAGAAVALTPVLGRTAVSAVAPSWQDVPVSLGADVASLDALALVNRHWGWAGGELAGTAYNLALARWNGRAWSRFPIPEPFGGGGVVMAAADRRHLWLMGYGTYYSAFWDGSAWHEAEIPRDPAFSFPVEVGPYSISAARDGTAWAVLVDVVNDRYAAVRWEDGAWARVPVPVPDRGVAQRVAVRSSRDVWISGWYRGESGSRMPFSLHWDGRSWTSVAVSPPGQPREGQTIKHLFPVSRSLAWAYRSWDAMPTRRTLLRWTGGDSWQEFPLPDDVPYTGGALADDGRGGVWIGGGDYGSSGYGHFRDGGWTVLRGPSRRPDERADVMSLARVPGTRTVMAVGQITYRDTGNPSGYAKRPFVERLH